MWKKTLIVTTTILVLLSAFAVTFTDASITDNEKPIIKVVNESAYFNGTGTHSSPHYNGNLLEDLSKKLQYLVQEQTDKSSPPPLKSQAPEMTLDSPPSYVCTNDIIDSIAGPEWGNASLEYPGSIMGMPDDSFAHLYTEEYRDIETNTTDEVIIVAAMQDWAFGNVFLTGYSEECAYSKVCISTSDSLSRPMLEWDDVGVAYLTQTNQEVVVGTAPAPFRYIAVYCWAEPDHELNDAFVDSVSAVAYCPSSVLVVSAGTGGTTDPEPGGYYYYGETAEVEAIPDENYEFDYWDIDFGNDESTDNPIYIDTWDSDHYLTAHFVYVPPQQSLTISAYGGGTTDPAPGTHWYNYGSGAEVDAVGGGFSYWLLDDEYIYTGSSISITMDQYHTLEAHFNEQIPACEVTVYGIEASSWSSAEADVYVDSQYLGGTNSVYNVANLQQHTIEGSFYAYVPYWQAYGSPWWTEVNGEFYDYGAEATVTPSSLHMTITFVYICAK